EAITKVAGTAEEKVVAGITENGAFVPNYLEGRDILVRATQEGRAFQEKSEIASNRIFVAELAIESLANLKESADNGTFAHADAEILYGRLQREGFHSYAADAALRDARRTIREGSYDRAIEHLERALQAFARRTNARASLGKDIEETRTRVRLLAGSGLSFLPDIQEVLGRAEREFHQGNYSGSSEDLRVATVLLEGVTHAPGPKK